MTEVRSTPSADAAATPRWRRITRSPWAHLLAAIIVVALFQSFVLKLYQVPSESMEQTLQVGDRMLVNRLAYVAGEPSTHEIIVFNRPESWGENEPRSALREAAGWVGDLVGFGPSNKEALVKRVIGLPGQRVECCDAEGRVTVDGEPLDESYVSNDLPFEPGALDCDSTPVSQRCFDELTVPAASYLVLGDHRSNSSDSVIACRGGGAGDCARFVPESDVVGPVFTLVFPFDRAFRPLAGP